MLKITEFESEAHVYKLSWVIESAQQTLTHNYWIKDPAGYQTDPTRLHKDDLCAHWSHNVASDMDRNLVLLTKITKL